MAVILENEESTRILIMGGANIEASDNRHKKVDPLHESPANNLTLNQGGGYGEGTYNKENALSDCGREVTRAVPYPV